MASSHFPAAMQAVRSIPSHINVLANKQPVSWAGLLYLTLFLASKFSVAIPYLAPRAYSTNPAYTSAITRSNLRSRASTDRSILPVHKQESTVSNPGYPESDAVVPIRYQSAAPPVYTLALVLTPVLSAIYVCSTRFTDFRHFGFDLLFGSLIGITCAWFSFRWYHLPITRGAGWACRATAPCWIAAALVRRRARAISFRCSSAPSSVRRSGPIWRPPSGGGPGGGTAMPRAWPTDARASCRSSRPRSARPDRAPGRRIRP